MRGAILLFAFLGFIMIGHAGLKEAVEEKTKTEEKPLAGDLVLVSAEFGLVEKGADGVVQFKATDKVPLVAGQGYGWHLRFKTKRETVALREELELPVAPAHWDSPGPDVDFKVSPDGRTGVTWADAVFQDGAIMNAWQVADGDPAGPYEVRLYIEGKLVKTFKFDVVKPASAP